mmetsp:Transcript_40583/g.84976  ORF Transcript_40583/g.84976 Transcript_40583/m.84976 type:complete len:258 (-) Transcript_40583:431-1204(-)
MRSRLLITVLAQKFYMSSKAGSAQQWCRRHSGRLATTQNERHPRQRHEETRREGCRALRLVAGRRRLEEGLGTAALLAHPRLGERRQRMVGPFQALLALLTQALDAVLYLVLHIVEVVLDASLGFLGSTLGLLAQVFRNVLDLLVGMFVGILRSSVGDPRGMLHLAARSLPLTRSTAGSPLHVPQLRLRHMLRVPNAAVHRPFLLLVKPLKLFDRVLRRSQELGRLDRGVARRICREGLELLHGPVQHILRLLTLCR